MFASVVFPKILRTICRLIMNKFIKLVMKCLLNEEVILGSSSKSEIASNWMQELKMDVSNYFGKNLVFLLDS
ncbi:hypothetical protein NSMS1_30220 [Nostoc sp. MS1]|nr:hypothetical protein NSMS1_30220 [Nostoc sp. MS1]